MGLISVGFIDPIQHPISNWRIWKSMILLMVQKSGKLTSWYGTDPIKVLLLHPRWLFGISEPSTVVFGLWDLKKP